jgi:hypothetical protein
VHPTIEITHPDTTTTNQNKEGKNESHSSLFGKKDSPRRESAATQQARIRNAALQSSLLDNVLLLAY